LLLNTYNVPLPDIIFSGDKKMNEIINKLSEKELIELKQKIDSQLDNSFYKDYLSDLTKGNQEYVCPCCQSTNIVKNGKTANGTQRIKCNSCQKTKTVTKNKLTFSSKKEFSQWAKFIDSLLAQDSIKVSCVKAGISRSTAFRWRIKVLNILANQVNNDVLEGTIYLDETMVSKVLKDHNFPYNPEKKKKRGMSNDKISVACAIDNSGRVIIKVADIGRITTKALLNVYEGKIREQSIVVSDSLRSYHKLMAELKVVWKKIPSKKKSIDEYDLEPINHLHAQIKDFLYYYKGISLKYLQGYLSLFSLKRLYKRFFQEKTFKIILKTILDGFGHLRCEDIDYGDVIIA